MEESSGPAESVERDAEGASVDLSLLLTARGAADGVVSTRREHPPHIARSRNERSLLFSLAYLAMARWATRTAAGGAPGAAPRGGVQEAYAWPAAPVVIVSGVYRCLCWRSGAWVRRVRRAGALLVTVQKRAPRADWARVGRCGPANSRCRKPPTRTPSATGYAPRPGGQHLPSSRVLTKVGTRARRDAGGGGGVDSWADWIAARG